MRIIIAKTMPIVILIAMIGAAGPIRAAELSRGEKDTIFVAPMKVLSSIEEQAEKKGTGVELSRIAQSLESQFTSALSATRIFQLVNRSRLEELNLEQAFSEVSVDPDDEKAARMLKMTGARFAFFPRIDGFEDRSDVDTYQAIGRSSMTRTVYLSAQVQIVDTTTGELLPDVPAVQLSKVETAEMARTGNLQKSDSLLVDLAREMANTLSQRVVGMIRPAKVLAKTGNQILINRGSPAGFIPGAAVEVFAVQEIIDEDSGETFQNEIPVGKAEVSRGDSKKSFADIVGEDLGIAKGCIVRVEAVSASGATLPRATWSGGRKATGTEVAPGKVSPDTPGSSSEPLKW